MLYLGITDTNEAQLKILQALTRKFHLDPKLDLISVVEKCPFNFTGADFYALCSDALLKAMTRKAEEIDDKIGTYFRTCYKCSTYSFSSVVLNQNPTHGPHPYPINPQYYLAEMVSKTEIQVTVSQADFDNALRELTPSVSSAELEHYARIQKRFSRGVDDTPEGEYGHAHTIVLPGE